MLAELCERRDSPKNPAEISNVDHSRKTRSNGQPYRPLLLTCQLLTDRMLLYSSWLERLALESDTTLWVTGLSDITKRQTWNDVPGTVEDFPKIRPFRDRYNILRRFNEFAWDFSKRPPSRLSMLTHVRLKKHRPLVKLLVGPARLTAGLHLAPKLEKSLEKLLLRNGRSPEAKARLVELEPDVVITTDPFSYPEPAVVAEAKSIGIKTLAIITSWDNLSTKNRMVFQYDGYVVWSEQMRKDLHYFYPHTAEVPCYVVGATQFDVFFQERFEQSREEFCRSQGLLPDKPIVVYALGSPNFLKELHGAVEFIRRIADSSVDDVQILVRPHPMFFDGTELKVFEELSANVRLQRCGGNGKPLVDQVQTTSEVRDWVNTFRHADVVVNLSSTVAIDAAIFDRPVVNLDFDPEPGQPNQELIKDINHKWTHFKPIAESGGVWLVNNYEEMIEAVRTYLKHPELHKSERRWIAEYVCGHLDGKCGDRMAEAILDFAQFCMRTQTRSEGSFRNYVASVEG